MYAELTCLLIDDHPLFMEGLTLALSRYIPAENLLTCSDSEQALNLLIKHPEIDLVLLDLNLPGQGGLSLLQEIRKRRLPVPVVILSASEDSADVHAAIVAGASGFINKASGSASIMENVVKVLNGDICTPAFYHRVDHNAVQANLHELNITPRQLEVLKLLAAGMPNKRICTTLGLTEHTVKSHLKALFTVLEVHNRTECVTVANRLGLV